MKVIPEGALVEQARRVAALARASGALETLPTRTETVESEGTRFLLRELEHLERKRRSGGSRTNPFLPPEPELTVGTVSETHLCVLNKFNVVDLHLLFVTREYEDQEAPLTRADIATLARGLRELDGLAFYNSGPAAGASQAHRHLQLVPTPLGEGPERFPLEALYAPRAPAIPDMRTSARFVRVVAPCPKLDDVQALHEVYVELLAAAGTAGSRPTPYNLLATRDVIALVPRSRESAGGISVNALGFAGSLFVGSPSERERLRAIGPWSLLRAVGEQESPR